MNDVGQLGFNDTIDRSAPTRIDPSNFNNEKVIQVESSSTRTLVLTEANKVYTWGKGILKPFLLYRSDIPILDIDVGGNDHTTQHIVLSDGRVASSGSNYYAQFGNGLVYSGSLGACNNNYYSADDSFIYFASTNATIEQCANNPSVKKIVPETEEVLSDIVDISQKGNSRYVLGLGANNKLYIWGETKKNFATPLPNSSQLVVSKIETGKHPTFLTTNGELYYYPDISKDPVRITLENSSEKIIDITSGADNLLALGESGKLYALGPNSYGQIGNVIPSIGVDWNTKVALYTGINNVLRIGSGIEHTILQLTDNNYVTLGRNSYGQLATTDVNSKTTFVKNPLLTNIKDILGEQFTSFAVTNDNKFYSWGGKDANSRLNRTGDANTPALVKDFSSISNVVELNGNSENSTHGNLLLENGTTWNFGHPYYNGLGVSTSAWGPRELKNANGDIASRSFNVTSAFQGHFSGLALTDDNKIYTWGYDEYAMLGLGYRVTQIDNGQVVPGSLIGFNEALVPSGEIFTKVYAGYYKKLILTADGKVYAWGNNTSYQLGLSSNREVPTLVNTLPPIKEISLGRYHTLFLDYEGNIWSSGQNSYGQLGLGNTTTPFIPTKIPTLKNVKSIGTGEYSSYAVLDNGSLYSFGDNRYGQLGLGDLVQRNEPRLVPGISDVKEVDGGLKHALLITNAGDLYVTGSDGEGQLGLAQSQTNPFPIIVASPPNVSINNKDNQIFTTANTLDISGDIYSESTGVSINVSYELESSNGKTSSFIKNYTTSSSYEPYSFSLPLSNYELGSYTLTINAITASGVSSQSSINFSVQDTIKPTLNVDKASASKWTTSPVNVNVTADDDGGSGYRGFRYALSTSTSKPSDWSVINSEKSGIAKIDKSGALYLHLEAYDKIGNITYKYFGPYYMDVTAPDIDITEPAKWQQDGLDLGVIIKDASNITAKKWMKGTPSLEDIKTSGDNISTNLIPVIMNGVYSFYAMDENNQETLKTYTVSNINYKPSLHSIPSKILVPAAFKSTFSLTTNFSHKDNGDAVQMVTDLGNVVFTSSNKYENNEDLKDVNWDTDYSTLTENILYNGNIYLKDSRGGISNKLDTQLEVYNPNLTLKSTMKGMDISWTHSKLSSEYRLSRDGEVIYTGTDNSYFDTGLKVDTAYFYRLEVLVDGVYVSVDTLNKNSGYNLFETPSRITFAETRIGDYSPITATDMDLEYVKYEDFSDIASPYSLRVSISNFSSSNNNKFTPQSFVLKKIKKIDRNNLVEKTLADVYITETPTELVGLNETSTDSFTNLEILQNNVEMVLPLDITLNTSSIETFNSTIVWDITFAP
ncbi:hypothetical protein MZM54_05035 [[Brevibacterium] frigoritolerans]|nr:hypothetical protein [Peribacillus frigoritolerans]